MKLTLDIENEQDLFLILSFAQRIGIKILEEPRRKDLEYHKKIIAKGVKKSSFGDPVLWQKETRKDRKLPFRAE